MVIFLRELKRNRKAFITWTAFLLGANVLMLMLFPYMDFKSDMVNEMLKQMPEGMISALNLENLDLSKILPFFAYIFQYIVLFSSIYAMQFGASILSREEGEKTVEFLLCKPVRRSKVVTSKLLCLVCYLVLFNVMLIIANYIAIITVTSQSFSFKAFLVIHFGQFLLQLIFASVGYLISVFVVKTSTVLPLSVGVVLGCYFINIVSSISDKLDALKYITPFRFVIPSDIMKKETIEPVYIAVILATAMLSLALTYVFYNKKDISV